LPDVVGRDELERKLARKLGSLQRAQMMRLLEHLGDPPKIENVPAMFWDEVGKELAVVLAPFLEEVYLTQAKELMLSQPIGIEWSLIHERAVTWVQQYTFDMVRDINQTSRSALQKAVSAYFERGQTIGELEQSISGLFGPIRASMIAQTEITRASVMGERSIALELEKVGIRMIPIFATSSDEKVCPICAPLNGKEVTEDLFPPRHVNCRCWLNHELPKAKR